jgi:aldose 1-epimerase
MTEGSQNVINIPGTANFFKLIENKKSPLYLLRNKSGMLAAITNCGGKLVSLLVPDHAGRLVEVIGGFEGFEGFKYCNGTDSCNKIEPCDKVTDKSKFKFDNKEYILYVNNRLDKLHRDKKDFNDLVWKVSQPNNTTLELTYHSNDSDEIFSNNLNVKVTYALSGDNGLKICHEAVSDKMTESNITNHIFFNLNGPGCGSILNHIVQINADNYIPEDRMLLSAGKIAPVSGTPFDFRKSTTIGARINDNNEQLKNCKGYNHNFVLNKHSSRTPVARVKGDKSGIIMEICTEDPALLFYSGELIKNKNIVKESKQDFCRTAFAMETPYFPGSPSQKQIPVKLFNPDQIYKSATIYRFKTGR